MTSATGTTGRRLTPPSNELRSLRQLHFMHCSATALLALEGPPQDGGALSYAVYLCPDHLGQGLDGFPGAPVTGASGMSCGTVTDFRDTDTILRSHADLWLGPLFGAHPDDHGHDWAAAVHWACSRAQALADTPEGAQFGEVLLMLEMAAEYAESGDKRMLGTALSNAETMALAAHRGELPADDVRS
jgi:hypothetical protein